MRICDNGIDQMNRPLTACVRTAARMAYGCKYRIRYEGLDNVPDEGATLLLAKHQTFDDIPLESFIAHEGSGRAAYFVMRHDLSSFYQKLGGLPVYRPEALSALEGEAKKDASAHNTAVYSCIEELLGAGEMVVMHPEGTRRYRAMNPIDDRLLVPFIRMERRRKLDINYVPVGLEYGEREWLRQDVTIRAGEPYSSEGKKPCDLLSAIRYDIKVMSGL